MAQFTLQQGTWRWFTDATPDSSMVALAGAGVTPTLTTAQMQNGIIRLRLLLNETGGKAGSATLKLQYSQDQTNWLDVQEQTPTSGLEGAWIRYANGAATDGGTLTSLLVIGTGNLKTYHEDGTSSDSFGASSTNNEVDFALKIRWPPPDITVYFRVLADGAVVTVGGTGSTIRFTTSTAANREYAITYMAPHTDGTKALEVQFAPWHRMFYDGTRWWFFTVQPNDASNIAYYYWDGPGNDWSAKSTISMTGTLTGALHAPAFKVISGTPVVFIVNRSSSGTRYWRRGEISGTTITWDTEGSQSIASDRHVHASIDDGNYWWIGGITAGSGVWAARATNADTGTSWTPGFNTPKTASDSGVTSGDVFSITGLSSDKALAIWHNGTTLKWALVTDAGGFGTVNTLVTDAHESDWGVVRSGGYVYVAHTNAFADDSTRKFSVFNESSETFSSAADPGDGGAGDTGSGDGLPLCADGDDIYYFGVFQGSEGGQDRTIEYRKYAGPGAGGSWDTSRTEVSPSGTGPRGNADYLGAAPSSGGGVVPVYTLWGDDTLLGSGFAVEYFTIAVSSGTTKTFSGSSAAAATATGDLDVKPGFSGSSAAAATATGDLDVSVRFSGTSTAVSVATGQVGKLISFSGSSAATSVAPSGDLDVLTGFSGSSAAQSNAPSGDLDVSVRLSGSSAAQSTAPSGQVDRLVPFSGLSASITATSGQTRVLVGFSGSSAAQSTASGGDFAVGSILDFSGSSAAASTATGDLDVLTGFSGSSAAASTATGDLDVLTAFSGSSAGQTATDGPIDIGVDLSGSSGGAGTASGDVDVLVDFSGSSTAQSTATGDFTVGSERTFSGSSAAQSTAPSGALNVLVGESGSSAAQTTTAGPIDILADLSGQSDGVGATAGDVDVLVSFSGSSAAQSTASGGSFYVQGEIDFSGQSDAQSTAPSGDLDVLVDLSGLTAATSVATGVVGSQRSFSGSSVAQSNAPSGDIDVLTGFSGQSDATTVAGSAVLDTLIGLSGQSDAQSVASAGAWGRMKLFSGVSDSLTVTSGQTRILVGLSGQSDAVSVASGGDFSVASGSTVTFSGQSDAVTVAANAVLDTLIGLSGQSDAVSVAGNVVLDTLIGLSGQADGAATADGDLSVLVDLSGQSDAVTVASGGDFDTDRDLTFSGQSDAVSVANGGDFTRLLALAGQSGSAASADGSVNVEVTFTGLSTGISRATGQVRLVGEAPPGVPYCILSILIGETNRKRD